MKKQLQEMLRKKEEQRAAILKKVNESNDVNEVRNFQSSLNTLDGEMTELRGMITALPDDDNPATQPVAGGEQRSVGAPVGQVQVLAAYGLAQPQTPAQRAAEPEDYYATPEYRRAFMTFAKTGQQTAELRANEMTGTNDVSAIIPTTIMKEVIKQVKTYGQVYNRTRKTSIRGGVSVPILSLKPVATWIGENGASDKQKVQVNTKVTFSYFGLECKVSQSLLADTVTLEGFENTIIDLIVEAIVKALDLAIIRGDGINKPMGIINDPRVPAAQIIELTPSEFVDWEKWQKKVIAKLPLSYKAGAAFFMASGTFEGYINGMTDANGQPIGRVNYGITEGSQNRFCGREVVEVEDDVISNYDDAAVGDVVAILVDLRNYVCNSNMQMTMFRYFDHDTNEWVDKAILIMDGKVLDPNGVIIVKKAAEPEI